MRPAVRGRLTAVWLVLMALTVVTTWILSKDAFAPGVAVVGTFVIAAVKVRLVMLDFMELRHAPTAARVGFQIWIVAVTALILGFWFLTPGISLNN